MMAANSALSISQQASQGDQNSTKLFHTLLYDYFRKNKHYDCARAMLGSKNLAVSVGDSQRSSPGMHHNGINDHDDEPSDLPPPMLKEDTDLPLITEWWGIFWDLYCARHGNSTNSEAMTYLQQIQPPSRNRPEFQSHLQKFPPAPQQLGRPNGALSSQQQSSLLSKRVVSGGQMKGPTRDSADLDINGPRAQSPASNENAPSPSKRLRLSGPMNQLAPNGRPGPQMDGGQPMVQNGSQQGFMVQQMMDPGMQMNRPPNEQKMMANPYPAQLRNAQMAQRMANAMPNQAASPMMNGEAQMNSEYYGAQQQMARSVPPGQGGNANGALQDYQMQLMLLEQQNKKRLMQAQANGDGQPGMQLDPNGNPMGFTNMSPQGSQSGPSPTPVDQLKRGNMKTGQPGSPLPESMQGQRSSPSAMMLTNQMPIDQQAMFMNKMEGMPNGMPNGMNMRPPTSFAPAMQNNGMMMPGRGQPVQNWQQQMMPQGPNQPPQMQQMNTPQQRNAMPPPSNVPPVPVTNGRVQPQPPSPQPNNAPTPQAAKAAPKAKAAEKRKRPAKKASTNAAATPSADTSEPPPTPGLSNPNTPHAQNFILSKNGQAPPAPMPMPPQPQDQMTFTSMPMDTTDYNSVNMDFGPIEGENVLEGFEFDEFLNMGEADTLNFDPAPFLGDTVEAGQGEV